MNKKKVLKNILNIYTVLGFILILSTLVLIGIPIAPYVIYRLDPQATEKDVQKIVKEVVQEDKDFNIQSSSNIPALDTNLPLGYHVVIPSQGIDSPISDSKDYKKALVSGTWIVNDYGTPENNSLPIILAAHRFGYSNWSKEYRNRISFFNLPNTKIDDEVYIYWNQRKYIYKIYALEESTYISDYSADLILYTCKYFNSPVRIFRYAQRVN